MTTIDQAIALVKQHCAPSAKTIVIPLEESCDYVTSSSLYALINMPSFRQSAVDGYALCVHEALHYNLVGEVKAGDSHQFQLKAGEVVRIFTGAPVPNDASSVVMQEKVSVSQNSVTLAAQPQQEENIRPLGEQAKVGDVAISKGTKLNPAALGYLASLGVTEVEVYKKPTIAVVATGNELVAPGEPLAYGQIYESNSLMLKVALAQMGIADVSTYKLKDEYVETRDLLNELITRYDMVIISGGISVGDYDFVGKALSEIGVDQLFYKVKQKPGKPLYFGKKNDTIIFALPGNPAAALTCYYIYIYTAIQIMSHKSNIDLPKVRATSITNFSKNGDRPQFLKATYQDGHVTLLDGQSSAMLQTFGSANALVYLPEEVLNVEVGDGVEVILF